MKKDESHEGGGSRPINSKMDLSIFELILNFLKEDSTLKWIWAFFGTWALHVKLTTLEQKAV